MMAAKVTKAGGIASEAVLAKTGKTWDQWLSILDKAGANKWPHKEIAAYIHEEHGCPGWWSQMVTVGYEQVRGLRVKNQLCSGEFSANASKTIQVPIQVLYKHWNDAKLRRQWLPNAAKVTIRKANLNKNLRITWPDETAVEVNFWDKGTGKSQAAVQHRKLESAKEVERVKALWTKALGKLQSILEGENKSPMTTTRARSRATASKA